MEPLLILHPPFATPFHGVGSLEVAMADLAQKLPLELLAEILAHASVPDILRFKQVRESTEAGTDWLNADDTHRLTVPSTMPFFSRHRSNTR